MTTELWIVVVAVTGVERPALLPHPFMAMPLRLASPVVVRRAIVMAGPIALTIIWLRILWCSRLGLGLCLRLRRKDKTAGDSAEYEYRLEQQRSHRNPPLVSDLMTAGLSTGFPGPPHHAIPSAEKFLLEPRPQRVDRRQLPNRLKKSCPPAVAPGPAPPVGGAAGFA